jgi:hypothetical protein
MSQQQKLVSPVIVTHFSQKEGYGGSGPPSSRIVKQTIDSMRDKLKGIETPISTDPIVIYNQPKGLCDENDPYLDSLKQLSYKKSIEIYTRPNDGLREGLLTALEEVSTKYILFVEHDWKFVEYIPLDRIISSMENAQNINYIRFNKRKNRESKWDTKVVEDREMDIPLCKVSSYSNNPHIARCSTYREWIISSNPTLRTLWDKYRRDKPYSLTNLFGVITSAYKKYIKKESHVQQFEGVEFVLDTRYKKNIQRKGFDNAHSEWGIYLYGKKGAGPFVTHLGK